MATNATTRLRATLYAGTAQATPDHLATLSKSEALRDAFNDILARLHKDS